MCRPTRSRKLREAQEVATIYLLWTSTTSNLPNVPPEEGQLRGCADGSGRKDAAKSGVKIGGMNDGRSVPAM